jgi:DNA-binding MarR family transcriptional regulator
MSMPEHEFPLQHIMRIAQFRADLRAFLRHNEIVCREVGLTPQRYLLLLAIKGAPDGSQRLSFTDVADRLQLTRNTVTELCARAEQAGLIKREPSQEDQRVVYLRLTPLGERRLLEVIRRSEGDRRHLRDAFAELAETFRVASRRTRSRP